MSTPTPPAGGDHGHGMSAWQKLFLVLAALALGGIAYGMFTGSIADAGQYMYIRQNGLDYMIRFWKNIGIAILTAVALGLIIKHYSS